MSPLKIGEKTARVPLIQGGMGGESALEIWQGQLRRRAGSASFQRPRSVFGSRTLTRTRQERICGPFGKKWKRQGLFRLTA